MPYLTCTPCVPTCFVLCLIGVKRKGFWTTRGGRAIISMCTVEPLSSPVLRDTARLSQRYPPVARYEVFAVSTWPIGCDNRLPLFLRSLLESMRSGGAIPPPPQKRILARYHMKTRQLGAIPFSAILSRKDIARYGGYLALGR